MPLAVSVLLPSIVGFIAVSSQIIIFREGLTIFYGNELAVGILFFLWFISGSFGSWLFGRISNRSSKDNELILWILFSSLALTLPFSIYILRAFRGWAGIVPGEILSPLNIFMAAALSVFIEAVILGMLFTQGVTFINKNFKGRAITMMYLFESVGASAGGFVTSIFLVRYFNNMRSSLFVSILAVLAALLITVFSRRKAVFRVLSCMALIIFVTVFFTLAEKINMSTRETKWQGIRLIDEKSSIYGDITVTKNQNVYTIFENGVISLEAPDTISSENMVHFAMLASRSPKKVLLIGGGIGDRLVEILKYCPASVTYIELNPEVVNMAEKYFLNEPWFRLKDQRVKIINSDARVFLETTKEKYDVAIINKPNPYTAEINRFYTKEFYKGLKNVLTDDGIAVFAVSGSENYISSDLALFLKAIFKTAASVFPEVKAIPGDTIYFIVSSSDGKLSMDPAEIEKARLEKNIDTTFVAPYYLNANLAIDRVVKLDNLLRSGINDRSVRLNTDLEPVSYYFDMVLWGSYFSRTFSDTLRYLSKTGFWAVLALSLFVLAIFFLLGSLKKNGQNIHFLTSLVVTGFSIISLEVLLLIVFQIFYGYMYYKMGFIFAIFMSGMAIGAFVTDKVKYDIMKMFKAAQLGLAILCAFFIVGICGLKAYSKLLSTVIGEGFFFIYPFLLGAAGGLQFPLSGKIFERSGISTGHAAGTGYAADLFGSCLGALCLSVFIVPLFGVYKAAVLLLVMNLTAYTGLVLLRRKSDPCRKD